MKDDNQGTEKEIQDPLTPYLDAEARRRASATKAPKSEDEGQDDVNDDYTIDGSPASDEAVRLAISQVPNLAGRRRIKHGADVLKRPYPEISGLRTPEDWERAYVVVEDYYLIREDLFPQGSVEDLYVEDLIAIAWRKRGIHAYESAVISKQRDEAL